MIAISLVTAAIVSFCIMSPTHNVLENIESDVNQTPPRSTSGSYQSYTDVFISPPPTTSRMVRNMLPESPLKGLSKQIRGWTYSVDGARHVICDDDLKSKFRTFIQELANLPTCIDAYGNSSKCTCLHYLRDQDDEVIDLISKALLNYSEMTPSLQKAHQLEKIQYSQALADANWSRKLDHSPRTFVIPMSMFDAESDMTVTDKMRETFQHRICRAAWGNLHNIGQRRLKT